MSLNKINVRRAGAEGGALGKCDPVVGMTTINNLTIDVVNSDGTVVVSGNSSIGGSGIAVSPDHLFIDDTMAASGNLPGGLGAGTWPTGADCILFNWRSKTDVTTTH